MTTRRSPGPSIGSAAVAAALCVIYLPYVIKRAALTGTPDELYWLSWDYSIRIVSLIGIGACYRNGFITDDDRRTSVWKSVPIFLAALICLYLLYMYVRPVLVQALPYLRLFRPPLIQDTSLLVFDLTIGLALVAVSEELAFRRVAFSALRRLGFGEGGVLFLSAAGFALVHLTSGLGNALNTFLFGLLLGSVFRATGRLSLCIVLHYLDGLVVFGGAAALARFGSPG